MSQATASVHGPHFESKLIHFISDFVTQNISPSFHFILLLRRGHIFEDVFSYFVNVVFVDVHSAILRNECAHDALFLIRRVPFFLWRL